MIQNEFFPYLRYIPYKSLKVWEKRQSSIQTPLKDFLAMFLPAAFVYHVIYWDLQLYSYRPADPIETLNICNEN